LAKHETAERGYLMATVTQHTYRYHIPEGVQPNRQVGAHYGPGDWFNKAIVATAQPFALSTTRNRELVAEVRLQIFDGTNEYLHVVKTNVGEEPIFVFTETIAVISP
jgi:hypothetical protein